jgi:uncharacterized protein YceK
MIVLRVVLIATALLLLSSCGSYGSRYSGSSVGASYYYGGSSWYDPFYSRRCCRYPSRPPSYRPPSYRPPSAGPGRPVNLPSRAPSRPSPSLRR